MGIMHIDTLGIFDIRIDNKSILKESSRSYKAYKLFQYFLTFKNKKHLPETILDNLWHDSESFDPKNMLRAQICRLRQIIKLLLPEGEEESKYLQLTFNGGYYTLEIGEHTVIDIDLFERYIIQGDELRSDNPKESMGAYMNALKLYKGNYMGENAYELWLIPMRNYYRRIYVKTALKLIELLDEFDEHERIVEMCEEIIGIVPEEESIHISLMEAMLKLGQIRAATNHYDYLTTNFGEMINTTTPDMKKIYRKIQEFFEEKSEINLESIKNKLIDKESNQAILCEMDYFKFLYNVKAKSRQKEGKLGYVCIITLDIEEGNEQDSVHWSKTMTNVLRNTLRKGDVFTFWNDHQVLIMLEDMEENNLNQVEARVKNKLLYESKKFKITIKCTITDLQIIPNDKKLI